MSRSYNNIIISSDIISDILPIERSEAKSWYQDDSPDMAKRYAPEKAYDGDYTTRYTVKDGDAEGNYLKLFLSDKHRIDSVVMSNQQEGCCEHRIVGTVVMVYSTEGEEETKVANCGEKITGKPFSLECTSYHINLAKPWQYRRYGGLYLKRSKY